MLLVCAVFLKLFDFMCYLITNGCVLYYQICHLHWIVRYLPVLKVTFHELAVVSSLF